MFTFFVFPTSDSYKRYGVTVLRCYGVTVWRVSGGKWRMRGKDPSCVALSHRRTVA